jgi:biotin carboxyl carrier protein
MKSLKIESEVTGSVWQLVAKPGDTLQAGDTILIVESMKMEIPVCAPQGCHITALQVAEGDAVAEGDVVALATPA